MTAVPIAGSGSIYRGPRFAAQRRSAALSCALRALRGGFSARWDRISTSASFALCFALKEYSVAAARSMPNLAWPTGTGWFLGRPVAAFGQMSVLRASPAAVATRASSVGSTLSPASTI